MKWYVLEWTSSLNTIIKMYRKSTLLKGGRLYVPWFIDVIFVKNDLSFMEKMIFWRDFSALENTFIKKIFLFKSKTIILFESRIQVEKKLWFSCLGSTHCGISCYSAPKQENDFALQVQSHSPVWEPKRLPNRRMTYTTNDKRIEGWQKKSSMLS